MKVVLLPLAANENIAKERIQEKFPGASIEIIPRSILNNGSLSRTILQARKLRPDVFVVAMESFSSQRGQHLLSLFSVLTGAREFVAIDSTGALKSESRNNVLARSPFRILGEARQSSSAILRSRRELVRLERAVRARETNPVAARESLEITYLRATPGPGTQFGGASSHINGFINAAVRLGAKIRVVSNDRIAGLDHPEVSFSLVPLQPVGLMRSAYDLHNNLVFTKGSIEEMLRHPPDFIYQRYGRFTWAGVAASLKCNRPLFLEYNGSEVWVGKYWDSAGMLDLLARVERLNLEAADRVFVVSEVERRNLLKVGVPDQKIVVNPNGVDVDLFRPNSGGDTVRKEFAMSDGESLVGFIGSFGPWHGVIELAKAITKIPSDLPVKFLLIGSGKLRGETEAIIQEAGMTDRVIFTGSVEHERVPALLDACDVLVSPHVPLEDGSDFFGSPTKLFEYMAMGKGLVASRLGQIGEILVDEESALLVEPGNIDELTQALIRLIEAPELGQRLGLRAREVVEANYTWNHNARRVMDTYRSFLANGSV